MRALALGPAASLVPTLPLQTLSLPAPPMLGRLSRRAQPLLRALSTAELGASAGASAASAAPQQQLPRVEPPPAAPFSADHVNSVSLIGGVTSEPQLYHVGASQTVTKVYLGVRPRFRGPPRQSVLVEAWGYLSLQLQQHVHKGMQIQVEGELREDTWTDKTSGQERRQHKVLASSIQVIEAPAASGMPAPPSPEQQQQQPVAAAAEAAASEPAAPRLTSAQLATHKMFQEGASFHAVAVARGVQLSTAVENVIRAASMGQPLDWQRAASELQLGPQGSPWITGDEVWAAISSVHAEEFPGSGPLERLMEIKLRPVRDCLEQGALEPSTATKLLAQESVAGGKWVTYGQIKLVIMMRLQGIDWNELIQVPPAPLPGAEGLEDAPPF